MSTSQALTPSCFIRARALPSVRLVVPKPGIVNALTFSRGMPSASQVLHTTSRASVESSPPETPMAIAVLADVLQPLRQPAHLRLENLLAAFAQLIAGRGHERVRLHGPQQLRLLAAAQAQVEAIANRRREAVP